MDTSTHERYWSDYWRNDGRQGEVFINAQGAKPGYLRQNWVRIFSEQKGKKKVLDIACGGGSVFEDINAADRVALELVATDISSEALMLANDRVPNLSVYCCDAQKLPFNDNSFDLVVSQFGIEYAGVIAFREAARVLANGGKLEFLCHYKGGYIDQRNADFLEGAELAVSTGFVDTAKNLIDASFSENASDVESAKALFMVAEKPLAESFSKYAEGIHHHLYFGFRELYLRRKKYRKQDIHNWLDVMQKDVEKNIIKVSQIRDVSLDDNSSDECVKMLEDAGLSRVSKSIFKTDKAEDIIAWSFSAEK